MPSIADRAAELLFDLHLTHPGAPMDVVPLAGGVSSDIALVHTPVGSYCVKFALAQLKVKAVWTAPVGRNAAEYEWLSYVAGILPDVVPKLYGRSDRLGGFAMGYLEPSDHPVWKTELLAGRVDIEFARQVGVSLGTIHAHAAADKTMGARFANQRDFDALRLDPYLTYTATQHPDLAETLFALVAELDAARISLVHGDVSPKNILMGRDGPIILDAECAVESDPAFDVAFCVNHLVIKSLAAVASPAALAASATALWHGYRGLIDWESVASLEARVARLLPALMLARVDGKSPVEYLSEDQRGRLRDLARDLLIHPPVNLAAIIEAARQAGDNPR